MKRQHHPLYEIRTDGRTVWINATDGLIGRFSPLGIDVHANPGSHEHCLDCRSVKQLVDPWAVFVLSMREHHNVVLGKSMQPEWSKHANG